MSFFNLVFEIPWLPYPTLYQNVMGVLQIGQTSISYIVNKLSIYTCLPLPLANMPMGLVLSQAHLQLWSFLSFSPLYRIGSRKKVWKGPQTPKLEQFWVQTFKSLYAPLITINYWLCSILTADGGYVWKASHIGPDLINM